MAARFFLGGCGAALFLVGCARGETPEAALEAYRAALRQGDIEEIRRRSDAGFRAAHPQADLERWAKKNPRLLGEAQTRLEAKDESRAVEARVPLEGGGEARLVWEGGAWKVAEGGWLVAEFDTPEHALETFFFAATGHLGLLRACLTDEAAKRFASDFALGKHLYAQRSRIFAARDAVGPLPPGRARREGRRAWIDYGSGKSAELVLEGERWRVVDVE
ncbi:MAG: hypothetical protein AAFZ18_00720 [Myxococcota bacterium]